MADDGADGMVRPPSVRAMSTPPAVTPLHTFVVKVVSRCNLNCSYCYMYNLEDRTWRGQPGVMKPATIDAMASRIREHSIVHGQASVHIILHGGEPMLMGTRRFGAFVDRCRQILEPDVVPVFSMQSNGTLVDDVWIDALYDSRVGLGLSLDGPKDWHDAFRIDKGGRGSFDTVIDSIRRLRSSARGRSIFGTIMAVVNVDIPPRELFEFWQSLDLPGFDLSLPHANHAHRPPRGRQSYGEWLIEFFDLWFDWNRPDRNVRYFENMIRMMFGYPISTDNIGGKPVGVIVIETDGGIEPTDAFKCCFDGSTKIGLNVHSDPLDALYGNVMVRELQEGASSLCATCQACSARDVCGGGYMPHRYSKEALFQNPSVYCDDLFQLVSHIAGRVVESLPAVARAQLAERELEHV